MRRCAGCMESKPKKELIRIASYEGRLTVDPTGKAKGRGVYLCPNENCLAQAVKKKALQRSLSMQIDDEEMDRLTEEIRRYGR
ncbi:MAG: YlxR family protein [Firmicutes bacterium]|nr:YlxR family protein [Bacillota bacterium]